MSMVSPLDIERAYPRAIEVDSMRNNAGFTLVELMIALALSLFLIGGALTLFSTGSRATQEAERLSRAQENLRFISNFLTQELRMTGSFPRIPMPPSFVSVSNGGDSLTVEYEAPTDCLGQPTVYPGAVNPGRASNTYSLQNGDLICTGKQGASEAMISGVKSLEFELIDGPDPTIPIGVVVSMGLIDEPFPDSVYEYTVSFRNPVLRTVFDE